MCKKNRIHICQLLLVKTYLALTWCKLLPCKKTLLSLLKRCIKPDCVYKLGPRCFFFGIDYLLIFSDGRVQNPAFYSRVMKPFLACVYLWGETNKDNYCQRILFIVCATSVSGESTCCSQSRPVCRDYQPRLLCYLFIPCSRALSSSYYTAGLADDWASRTKLYISGLKPCAFGPTVLSRNRGWKEKKGEEEEEREKEEEKKRDCSCGRVQIEFHINVCKFPRSCWLRLEKLISWMQRQYWCHQAERRGVARC